MPDAVAISEPGRDYTYGEFEDRSARLAAALADAGVGPGDKVGCYLYNGAAYLEAVFAAFKIGAVPVNANYRYTHSELSVLLADADAAALIFSGELAANVTHAARTVPGLRLLVRVGDAPPGAPVPDAPEFSSGGSGGQGGWGGSPPCRRTVPPEASRARGPARGDRSPARAATPGVGRALYVHGRHDGHAQGGDLAAGRPDGQHGPATLRPAGRGRDAGDA